MLCDNVMMFPYLWKVQFQAITNEWMFPRQTGSEETGHLLAHTCAMKKPHRVPVMLPSKHEAVRCTQKVEKHGF